MEIGENKNFLLLFREIADISGYLWDKGWAEKNAGNFSVNVTGFLTAAEKEILALQTCSTTELFFPGLSGQLFMISGSGRKMRDIALLPKESCCLIRFDEQGTGTLIQLTNQLAEPVYPSSELFTHLLTQQLFLERSMQKKAFIHTHTTELIALTQIPEFCSEEKLNNLLWRMHPETLIFIPQGIGFVPHSIPGTHEIARKTIKELENHAVVIWEKHGCLAAGETLSEAFDLIDLAAKSATIFFLCRRMGVEPQGLTTEQLDELRKHYFKF